MKNLEIDNYGTSTGSSYIKEIDIPKPLGFDVGYWGMPSCLGQGLKVLEEIPKYGKKCAAWEEQKSNYDPITGNHNSKPLVLDLNGEKKSMCQYNYLEMLGKQQEEERLQRHNQFGYFSNSSDNSYSNLNNKSPWIPNNKVSLASTNLKHRVTWSQDTRPCDDVFRLSTPKYTLSGSQVKKKSKIQIPKTAFNRPLLTHKKLNRPFISENVQSANEARKHDKEIVKNL
ncbi:hypothetical protein KC19_2G219900 [Ceratodon purpureus]|uniref:Uncharacterized protein n=1 Tax=Ceratodon purpureus TaxID=3225 RepID=A0A8T0IY62_CERPU|nr:hypothetical protein KC19_2G219900 [Ceratodon purpureus]